MGNGRDFVPSAEQCAAARVDVVFELRMLREVVPLHAETLQRMGRDAASMSLVSALRDSALLHTRTLHDFFLVAPKQDDIVASNFLDLEHADWRADGLLQSVAEVIADINKFRTHLTYTRIERTRGWSLELFLEAINAAFVDFLLHMTEPERAIWQAMIDSPDWRPTRRQSGFVKPPTRQSE